MFSIPATWTEYERELHRRTLRVVLRTTLALTGGLLALNLAFYRDPVTLVALLGVAGASVLALALDARGAYIAASSVIVVILLVATVAILVDQNGLRDPGIVALPLFVMCGVLLFGKEAAPVLFAATLLAVAAIAFAHLPDFTPSAEVPTYRRWTVANIATIGLFLAGGATVIYVVLDNADRHLAQIRASEAELRQAYDLTLEGWGRVVEYRDESTEGHSRRVAAMSERLARAMGLDEEAVLQVRRGALLHDIGKLAVPDAILLKPGPLDGEERAVMQTHPVVARDLLSGVKFLEPSLSIPYAHHERWDGTGYPEGLAGEEIPLAARIFSVVDHWEALTSDRPYRSGLPQEEVVSYLRRGAGTIFDPQVVRVFLTLL